MPDATGPHADAAIPAPAAPQAVGVAAALCIVSVALSGAGVATAQPWLAGTALLLASTVSILALVAAGFAVVDLVHGARGHRTGAVVRSAAALSVAIALVAAPAWALLLAPWR